jgi:4-amino-4-deoxy-L-arabinose transferase-like glycosyltransferase
MPFNEAAFWIGLTVAGTGFYFLLESFLEDATAKRRWLSLGITAIGAVIVYYSVYIHDHPNTSIQIPTWALLFPFIWLVIAYEVYERRRVRKAIAYLQTGLASLGMTISERLAGPPLHPTVEMLDADRRKVQTSREERIEDWRAMVTEIHTQMLAERQQYVEGNRVSTSIQSAIGLLDADPRFSSLRRWLSDETRTILEQRGKAYVSYGVSEVSMMDSALRHVLDDIDELAKLWGID